MGANVAREGRPVRAPRGSRDVPDWRRARPVRLSVLRHDRTGHGSTELFPVRRIYGIGRNTQPTPDAERAGGV